MKLALATCAPGPARFGYMFAVPATAVPSTATVVLPGGATIHNARASSSVISGSYANASAATTTSRTIGQITGQSPASASRMPGAMARFSRLAGHDEIRDIADVPGEP
jgi:hypothetical protein